VTASPSAEHRSVELTVDELAVRTGVPVRTIREYQSQGLLPPPSRRGRIGVYGQSHVLRLELIGRLQARGYSLAGIRDLVRSWRDGQDLADVLGVTADELVHLDEPGAPATLEQLSTVLPQLVPERLEQLIACGVIEQHGTDSYCVPSPSLLQLTIEALRAGYPAHAVLQLLGTIQQATASIADATIGVLGQRPEHADTESLVRLTTRGRGLLAHGTGRLTVHTIGRRLGVTTATELTPALRGLAEGSQ
jgi:DNA-binding transcriptional MerR regulator